MRRHPFIINYSQFIIHYSLLSRYIPILAWGRQYQRSDLTADLLAGAVVAIMLVPQGVAYAMLAGLPPQVGLYASILPLIMYGIFGSSRTLGVGPVAIVSILVASSLGELAEMGTADYMQLALTLAFIVGIMQVGMGLLRVGFLVNFLSHPVLAGFINGTVLVIGFSQLKHLLGLDMPRMEFTETLAYTVTHASKINLTTLAIGTVSIGVLLYFKYILEGQLKRIGLPSAIAIPLTKSAPLLIVLLGTTAVFLFDLNGLAGVKIVGAVPAGLPPLTMPTMEMDTWSSLFQTALIISFVGFVESISIAKSLARKRRRRVHANQELIALGIANLSAAVTGGYSVTGSFSRSVVNYDAGAKTGMASIITAVFITFTAVFLTPLFYYLPESLLAAIIMVAIFGLLDIKTFRFVWTYNKADAFSMMITFIAVLLLGIEKGVLVGVSTSLLLFILHTSRPHIAIIGRVPNSEIYLNITRYEVTTCDRVLAVRIDQSLYFANVTYLENAVYKLRADCPRMQHFIMSCAAVNSIDASALEALESLKTSLAEAGITFHLTTLRGPVRDRLEKVGFIKRFGVDHIHKTTHEAMVSIGCVQKN